MCELLDLVIQQVAGIAVPADAGFFEAGLTSATLVVLHARLQQRLGRAVPLSATFTYPSRRSLARYLVGTGSGATAAPPPVEVRPHRLTPHTRRDLHARIRDEGR